jgi:hypothetical protein
LTATLPVFAQPAPDRVIDLPAGLACPDFDLHIEIRGGTQVAKDFRDCNGNVVRTLNAGKCSALSFTNVQSGASLDTRPNGSVNHTTLNRDGTQTVTATGHNVLILFPSDVPAGPSTTLYVGRLVYTVDTTGTFTVRKFSGDSSDICAALSS